MIGTINLGFEIDQDISEWEILHWQNLKKYKKPNFFFLRFQNISRFLEISQNISKSSRQKFFKKFQSLSYTNTFTVQILVKYSSQAERVWPRSLNQGPPTWHFKKKCMLLTEPSRFKWHSPTLEFLTSTTSYFILNCLLTRFSSRGQRILMESANPISNLEVILHYVRLSVRRFLYIDQSI